MNIQHFTLKAKTKLFQASGSLSVSGVKQPQAAVVGAGASGGGGGAATTPISDADDELQKRLDNLRRE